MAKKDYVKLPKKDYVKLQEKAASFYDPSTGLQLANKQVAKMTSEQKVSKRVQKALKGGHLEYSDEDEYNDYLNTLAKPGKKVKTKKEEEEDDFDPTASTVEELKKKFTADEMKDLILKNNADLKEEDLPTVKAELAEIILNDYELEEEEEEEEDEDDE